MTEQAHLEKTLAILSDKLCHAQSQYIETKKTVHAKKTFMLSCKSLLQQDAAHVFEVQNEKQRSKRRRILPPPGLLPLLGDRGPMHKPNEQTNPTPTLVSCTGTILQDRIWLRLVLHTETRLAQVHPIWLSSDWNPTELDRSTAWTSHETILYAATTLPPLLSPDHIQSMDIKLGVRYTMDDEEWVDSVGRSIDWVVGNDWIMGNPLDTIDHWAPILYPYKAHLSLPPPPLTRWISLSPQIHLAPDAAVLLVQGSDHFSPLKGQIYALQNHRLALDGAVPWDGQATDTQTRWQHTIVACVDQSQSPAGRFANREHSLAQLATLLSPSFIEPL